MGIDLGQMRCPWIRIVPHQIANIDEMAVEDERD